MKVYEIKDKDLNNAINRQFSESGVEQKAFRYFARANRFIAGTATAYNPEFILTNLFRDFQQALTSVGVNLKDSKAKFVANYKKAGQALIDANLPFWLSWLRMFYH